MNCQKLRTSCRKWRITSSIGIDYRPISVLVVLIAIPKQELTERNHVTVVNLITGHITVLRPIDLRLTDAVGETERFNTVKINGVKATQHLEPFIPCLSSGALHERVKAPRFSKEHYNQVRHVGGAAPVPLRGSIASHVP